jgi:predicted membrane metal-binding protein
MPVRMRVFAFLLLFPITSGLLVSSLTSGNQLGLLRKQGDICLPKMQRNLLVASGQHVNFVYTMLFIRD